MQLPDESDKAVAVVVPVYNRLDLLRDTVESLRSQTLASSEFILVDDRSDPNVREYLNALPLEDTRFRVLHKPEELPRGCQSSRNIGLDAVTAQSVVFLDSDDLLAPSALEDRYAVLCDHSVSDIVVGRQAVFGRDGIKWVNLPHPGGSDLDRLLDVAGRIDVPWVNGGVLIRTSALRKNNIRWRSEFHWDDVAFHFECLLAGLQVHSMELDGAPDSWWRLHEKERYGSVLFSPDGIRNAAAMLAWMRTSLNQKTQLSAGRAHALSRSFFHFCVVLPLDQGNDALALEMIDWAEEDGLVTGRDATRMRAFRSARMTSRISSRVSAVAERIAKDTWMKEFIAESDSTFCSVTPVTSEAASSLQMILHRSAQVS